MHSTGSFKKARNVCFVTESARKCRYIEKVTPPKNRVCKSGVYHSGWIFSFTDSSKERRNFKFQNKKEGKPALYTVFIHKIKPPFYCFKEADGWKYGLLPADKQLK